MKKIKWKMIYIAGMLLICFAPLLFIKSAGMEKAAENDQVTKLPVIHEKGIWNQNYLKEMGEWFEKNFAFRQELISVNARLLSDVLGVSATEKVITGTDGWLYYSSTLEDYKGENVLSDRGAFNIARTIALIQKKVEKQGSKFVFVIPPNKNTLYNKNMPYYVKKAGETSNLKKVSEQLKKQKVNYADLYEMFKKEKETLYLKRDSHWNNKGAVLAYNAIMDAAKWPHNRYQGIKPIVKKDNMGDLSRMLYPKLAEPEENQYYPQIFSYDYIGSAKDVEDSEIITMGSCGTGSLLMYRDSFGNTLLPLMAGEFGTAKFSKLVPYYLDEEMEERKPDVVVVEKVERHIKSLGTQPPIMESSEEKVSDDVEKKNTKTTIRSGRIGNNMYMLMGELDQRYVNTNSLIYVKITDKNQKSKVYEAFPVTIETKKKSTDYGYQMYLKDESVPKGEIQTEIFVKNGHKIISVKEQQSVWKK